MEMRPEIEIVNLGTDKPYGVTRYLIRHTIEISLDDVINGNCYGVSPEVIDYIKSTLVNRD